MFDALVEFFTQYPYVGVAVVFLLCGLGLPLPEEIVLVAAGYICYQSDRVELGWMMATCAGAILAGDAIPFALGRSFGPSLLRVKPMRLLITPERLARFDRWFRRRGMLVIFISRFIAGIRVVSFFTAGTMRTSWVKFLILDGAGILIIVPFLVWLGHRLGDTIDTAIDQVQKVERGILITTVVVGVIAGLYYWLRWRRKQRRLVGGPVETYVEPSTPFEPPPPADAPAEAEGTPGDRDATGDSE